MTKRPIIWADVRQRLFSATALTLLFCLALAVMLGLLWLVATFTPWVMYVMGAAAVGWLIYASIYLLLYGED